MDQMIDQIKGAWSRQKPLDHIELDKLARYLVGQLSLDQVNTILPRSANTWYADLYTHSTQIAEACRMEPSLYSRLGRHLLLIRYSNQALYFSLVRQMIGIIEISLAQFYQVTGMSGIYLLEFLFHSNHQSIYHNIMAQLEEAWKREPEIFEQYIREVHPVERLWPLAFYCSKKDYDVQSLEGGGDGKAYAELLAQTIATHAIVATRRGDAAQQKTWDEALERHCPFMARQLHNKEMMDACAKLQPLESGDLFIAQYLVGYRLELVNQVIRAFAEVEREKTVASIAGAYRRYREAGGYDISREAYYYNDTMACAGDREEEIVTQMVELEQLLARMGLGTASLCAWAAGKAAQAPQDWGAALRTLYGDRSEVLREALSQAAPLAAIMILRELEGLGEPLQLERCRDLALSLLRSGAADSCLDGEIAQVERWLRSGGGEDPADLPPLWDHYHRAATNYYARLPVPNFGFDQAMCLLADLPGLPGRYLRYLAAQGHTSNVANLLLYIMELHGRSREQMVEFIRRNNAGAGTMAALADKQYENTKGAVSILSALVGQDADLAALLIRAKNTPADIRLSLLDRLYEQVPDYDGALLVDCLGDKSKKVRERALAYLMPRKGLSDMVRPLMDAKKKDLRMAAEQLLMAWEGDTGQGDMDIIALCSRNMPSSGTAGLRWALGGGLPAVRWRESGEKADDMVVQCYLSLLLGQKTMDIPLAAPQIRAALDEEDLHRAARQIYNSWMADGAPAKNKSALLLLGQHADAADVLELSRQIDDWSQHSRGAIASDAVRAMALGGSDIALMTVDNIGRKFKNKQVRRAGQEAFQAVAKSLGTTAEVLGDRIIPTLGFDERGELVIDYGPRQFTAILSTDLTIQLRDGTGKAVKSLPKPGAKDDTERAERAKKDFTALKKSLKAVVGTQSTRLEQALATGRRWDVERWEKLFVGNPIMHCFAIGLVWGAYQDDTLLESFRYLEEGGFTSMDEDDVTPGGYSGAQIGLVHPLDLTEEQVEAWREQLADYEITQPIPQMERPVYHSREEERSAVVLERFAGKRMPGITLVGKLQKLGWYRGSVQDGGFFYTFYKEVGEVGMQLYFSGMYVSPGPEEVITVGQAGFYKAGSVERGSYVYYDVKAADMIPLGQVNPRLLSELIYELDLATGSGTGEDKDWKSDSQLQFFGGKTPVMG